LISTNNLSIKIFDTEILNNISLDISKNNIIGILGKNGAGKSTFIKALSGFIKNYNGNIKIKNIELDKIPLKELAKIRSFVFAQENINIEFINVYQYLSFGRSVYNNIWGILTKKDKEIIEKVIEQIEIENILYKDIRVISSGEMQRVQIARALIQESEIIFLDEPTAHLDISFQIKIMNLLKKISDNIKIVCIFHDINLSSYFCEQIILLKNGSVYLNGKTEDVLTKDNLEFVFDCKWKEEFDEKNNKKVFFPVYF